VAPARSRATSSLLRFFSQKWCSAGTSGKTAIARRMARKGMKLHTGGAWYSGGKAMNMP
jgi:hypothetical protein